MPFYIVKIGGSLMGCAREIMRQLEMLTSEGYTFLIIPGGGPMADLIRYIHHWHSISEEAAHWMALLAMEQYAYFLADATIARLVDEISMPESGIEVLLPYQALLKDDDWILHSWNYTSDSVAAKAACRLKTDFVKATDVDGIIQNGDLVPEVTAAGLIGQKTCVDQGTLSILNRCKQNCIVMRGSDPMRFATDLKKRRGGTLIKG
jgi:hypothetical protein